MVRPCVAVPLVAAASGCLAASVVGSAPPFALELFPDQFAKERGASCLDHSPGGYYIRQQDPKRWVVFLEGGGLCVEPIDCNARRYTARGSSKYWQNDTTPEDNHMLTASTSVNPFADWSHVYLPYCSGDAWLGTSGVGHTILGGLQMSGHLILEAALERLANTTAFAGAAEVILSGTSAGGIGAFHHVDWLAEKLAGWAAARGAPPPRVAGIPVEGIFFPVNFPVLFPLFVLGSRTPISDFFSRYVASLFSPAWMHEGCAVAAKAEGFPVGLCFDISTMFKYIKTPVFVLTNQFDALMIQDLGACLTCKSTVSATSYSADYIRFFGGLMQQTLSEFRQAQPRMGFFATSEFHHDENFAAFFRGSGKNISGLTLRAALERWYVYGSDVALMEEACGEAQHRMPCASAVEEEIVVPQEDFKFLSAMMYV